MSHRGEQVASPGIVNLYRGRSRAGVLLAMPGVIVVLVLLLIPIGEAIYYSMTNWNGIS